MKKTLRWIWGLSLCIGVFLPAKAQDSAVLLSDSISRLLSDTTLEMDVRIQAINDLSYELINKDADLALQFVSKAIQLNRTKLQSETQFSNSYTILGIIHKNQGLYELAVTNYLESLNHAESTKDSSRISVCLNNIGVVFQLNNNEKEALEYYMRSIKTARFNNDSPQLSIRYYNIGESYQRLGLFDSAFVYYSNSMLIEEMHKSTLGIAYAQYGLATLFYDWGKFNKCADHLTIVQNLVDSIADIELKIKVLMAQANLSAHNENYVDAKKSLKSCIDLANEYEYKDLEIKGMESMRIILDKTGQSQELVQLIQKLYDAHKRKTDIEVSGKLTSLQKLYNLEVQARELDRLKSVEELQTVEVRHTKRIKNFLFIMLVVVTGIFGFNVYRLNRLRNKE